MMDLLEEAIIYATVLHQGKKRKMATIPYILHPLEVAQIISTMTDDQEVIAAGVLHDVVEDTDGTLDQIEKRFGKRVAMLVDAETEKKDIGSKDPTENWRARKEASLLVLKNSNDIGVKMLWLADKLSNIRAISGSYSEQGDSIWNIFHMQDPEQQCWYYRTVAEYVEYDLNRTGAYKELIKHINFIWPGTFASEKMKYKKYKEISIDGCRLIGMGAKGNVYRYDDELIVKVYKEGNTYSDVEREIELTKKAFVLGLPTTISFGIVAVGKGYGAMSELIQSDSISHCIARSPRDVSYYAKLMADLAHQIHETESTDTCFPDAADKLRERVSHGITPDDSKLAKKLLKMIDAMPPAHCLTHGDFHTGNVLMQNNEPILIDMDRLSYGHPIVDISGLYMSYIAFGEDDPSKVENYMGFSYATAKKFFKKFMGYYLGTDDKDKISIASDKAAILCYARMANHIRDEGEVTEKGQKKIDEYIQKIRTLLERSDIKDFII